MINYSTLLTCFSGLVGFRDSDNSCIPNLAPSLTGSTSGVYVTDVSGITPEVITDARSKDYSDINGYLSSVVTGETQNALNDFINQHKQLTKARHLLDNIDPVKYIQYFTDKVTKSSRFVGFEIKPNESDNLSLLLRQVGVQFDTLNTALVIYLFESSQQTAIKTFTLSAHSKVSSLQWFELTEWIANYKSSTLGTGQCFYLGYFEADLSGQAIDTKFYGALSGDDIIGCTSCGTGWVSGYQKHARIRGVAFDNSALNGTSIPDLKQATYTDQTFGLHLKISVTCDITEVICYNKSLFVQAVKNKIALRIFKDYFNSVRLNRNAELGRDKALANISMVEADYKAQLSGISFDFTDIDSYCQPCRKDQIKSGTLYT